MDIFRYARRLSTWPNAGCWNALETDARVSGDISGYAELDDRIAMYRLSPGAIRFIERQIPISESSSSMTNRGSGFSPVFRPSGILPSLWSLSRVPASAKTIPPPGKLCIGCCPKRCESRVTGRSTIPTQNRQVGVSSLITPTVRTSTTPRWFYWPSIPRDYQSDPSLYDRVVQWLLSFQNRDGGWAAFDKDVQNPLLENVPFADHNAILDPSCCDVTARVLEILGNLGYRPSHPAIRHATRFLKEKQEPDGAWYGRWGVNYIYGTSQVLRGLRAIGVDMNEPWIERGRDWLEVRQNEDGGWGETVASYDDPSLRGQGASTPSQSAWALLGLCAFPQVNRKSVERGVRHLVSTQNPGWFME